MAQLPPPEVGADEARDLADQVLSGRAYLEADRPPSLQDRLFGWIAQRFEDLFGALSSTGGRGITAWIVIAVFALLIAFLLSRLVRGWGPLPVRAASSEPIISVLGDSTAAEWLEQARQAEAAGDWRLGLRCRHRSLVTTLFRQGVIQDQPGQTAGEIAHVVALRHPDADEVMQQATWLFKDTWYGWIEADATTRNDFIALSEQVLDLTSREPAAVGS